MQAFPASRARAGRSRRCQSKGADPRVSELGAALVTAPFLLVMAGSVGIDRLVVLASEHIFVLARAGFPASRAESGLPPASGQSKWAGLLAYSALGAALVTAPFLFGAGSFQHHILLLGFGIQPRHVFGKTVGRDPAQERSCEYILEPIFRAQVSKLFAPDMGDSTDSISSILINGIS